MHTSRRRLAAWASAFALVSSAAWADHPVLVTMLVESFDGCGCLEPFDDPVSCGACPEGITTTHPDCDVFGPQSLDHEWRNMGFPADMYCDNWEPAQGFAAQAFALGDVFGNQANNHSASKFGAGDLIWIDYDNTASPTCGSTSSTRFEFEAARVARGLPPADPTAPAYFIISVRRDDFAGDGDTSDITTRIWMDLAGLPSGTTDTPVQVDVLPGTGWQDVIVNTTSQFLDRARLNVLVSLGPEGGFVDATLGEKVVIKVDNLRYVYTGLAPDNETDCGNGIDEDGDGLVDCEDADCLGDVHCACNMVLAFDTDIDGDVDMLDFAFFQRCITVGGPNNVHFESLPGDCKCLDLTGPAGVKDNSVDQYDLVMMLGCASGAEIPADASCDDPPAQ